MSSESRGYSETQACKHPLPERAHITNLQTGPCVVHLTFSLRWVRRLMMPTGLNGVLRGLVEPCQNSGFVPENNASTGGFERLQPIKRCHHCFAVENMGRQTFFMERLAKVTGICRKHGIATGQPYPERSVTRRVAVGGHVYDRTIAEDVVLAIYK